MRVLSAVCFDCARGRCNNAEPNPATAWRIGECGVCRRTQPVTDPSEWGGMKLDWHEPTAHYGETLNGGAVWRLREWERIFKENQLEFERRFGMDRPVTSPMWNSEKMEFHIIGWGIWRMPLSVWLSFVEQCEARAAQEGAAP